MNPNEYICQKIDVRSGAPLPYVGSSIHADRNMLAQIFCELGYKVGAEIGVWRGSYSNVLLESNPGLKLYCVDPWIGRRARSKNKQEWCYRHTGRLLKRFNAHIIRKTSADALSDIPDNSLDFVYIDASHDFDDVMFDIIHWNEKVRPGGIISGHDYIYLPSVGVIYAVDGYIRGNNINPWYITKDELHSWFWVKT